MDNLDLVLLFAMSLANAVVLLCVNCKLPKGDISFVEQIAVIFTFALMISSLAYASYTLVLYAGTVL